MVFSPVVLLRTIAGPMFFCIGIWNSRSDETPDSPEKGTVLVAFSDGFLRFLKRWCLGQFKTVGTSEGGLFVCVAFLFVEAVLYSIVVIC